jgi:hemin uptake protein HemP
MKTFIADIIPKIQRYSDKLDNLTLLTNQHWVLIENLEQEKQLYLFRPNNELLISKNGKIEKGKWEYLGNKSLLIDQGGQAFLFKHGFFDENLLALKIDSKDEYAFFVNENKYEGDINSSVKVLDFLTTHYLHRDNINEIENQTGIRIKKDTREISSNTILTNDNIEINNQKGYSTAEIVFFIILIAMILCAIFIIGSN